MKRGLLIIACVLVGLVLSSGVAPSARAFRWYMTYGYAESESRKVARASCEAETECLRWELPGCRRRSLGGFGCRMSLFFPGFEPGEEEECRAVLYWVTTHGGEIALRIAQPDAECAAVTDEAT